MRLDYYDLPRAREVFRLLSQKDDEGRVPADGLSNALRQLQTERTRLRTSSGRAAGVPTGARVHAGRARAPSAGRSAARRPAGRARARQHRRPHPRHRHRPDDAGRMWAASAGGGVWRTADGGAQWEPVDDFMANLAAAARDRPVEPDSSTPAPARVSTTPTRSAAPASSAPPTARLEQIPATAAPTSSS